MLKLLPNLAIYYCPPAFGSSFCIVLNDKVNKSFMVVHARVLSFFFLRARLKAVHEACANGHRNTVEQLLKRGADAQKVTFLGGETPLHLAVRSGERPLVFLLLRHGCDPNIGNKYSATCFHYAGSKPAIAKLLLR